MKRLCLLAILWVSACSSRPATHYYVLGANPPTPPGASVTDADAGIVLGVDPLTADPPYDQDQLVYRIGRDATEIGLYSYHRWVTPPGRLLQIALCKGLADLPGVAVAEPVRVGGDYAAHLGGRIVVLEEIDVPGTQIARLRLVLSLRDTAGATLWTREIDAEVPGQADEVARVVEQMLEAFEKVLAEAREGLGEALRGLE